MDLSTAMGLRGLSWDFTRDDVQRAYKRRMLESHPDRNPDPASTARAQQINEAKEYLLERAYISEYERREAKKRSEEEEVARDIKRVLDWLQEMGPVSRGMLLPFQAPTVLCGRCAEMRSPLKANEVFAKIFRSMCACERM